MKNTHKRRPLFFKNKSITGVRPVRLKNYKHYDKRIKLRQFKMIFVLVLVMYLSVLIYDGVEKRLMPTVMDIASFKINTVATEIINRAVADTINEVEINTEELVTYNYNEAGEIISWGLDTMTINKMTSNIIYNISEDVKAYDHEALKIPMGNAFSNSTFSDWGPLITVNIMPQGTATIDYDREFVASGINQVNHRVWLNVEMKMKVVIPLDTQYVIVNQKITLVDRILHGKIPDSYVVVPEENVLDVAK